MSELPVEITIYGPHSIARNLSPEDAAAIDAVSSYFVEGHRFAKAFKKGMWDGKKHLFIRKTGAFPTGLLNYVVQALKDLDRTPVVIDKRLAPTPTEAGFELIGASFDYPYDYQLTACKAAVKAKQGILKMATNAGKCLAPSTPVLLFDGSIKTAADVRVGDALMGPDSTPRRVLSTCTGVGPMHTISPLKRDMSWQCNDVHVLTLVHTVTGKIIDIPLDEYLRQHKTFKHCHKLFSVGVEFPAQEVPLDPYFLGLWIGDGTKALTSVMISKPDPEVGEYLSEFAAANNLFYSKRVYGDKCPGHVLTSSKGRPNPLLDKLRALMGEWKANAHIPRQYLINSREVRLQLLAGLLDTDGYLHSGVFEIIQRQKKIAEDIEFLARSLGFAVRSTEKVVNDVTYYRLSIVGHTDQIPTKLPRKKAGPRKTKWNNARTGFTVQSCGVGPYAGFTLDGDGRFLLGDFTVTHNTAVSAAITQYLGLPTLFIVTTRELMYQAQKRYMAYMDMTEDQIGVVGDGEWSPGSFVTVAIVDTLASRLDTDECRDLLTRVDVVFADEAHNLPSDSFSSVMTLCSAYYRYGMSGTPLDRGDGANLRLIALTGDLIVDISNKFLVERGVSAKATIVFDKITEPVLPKSTPYSSAYKQAVVENPVLLRKVVEWTSVFHKQGLGVLILCEEIEQGRMIDDALWTDAGNTFIPHQFIHGSESTEVRQGALTAFASGKLPVLVASRILDEGVDVPTIDALILAGSRKSKIRTLQRIGRGLRGKKLIVVEFANFGNKHLMKHSLQRLQDYKAEECFPVVYSSPDAALVKRLWDGDGQDK